MKKVLLVDDEIYSLKGMEVFIPWEEFGLIVCASTTDSSEAIELAIKEKPDIIITDINMPCIDGLELLKILKEKLPKAQGIVITGYDDFKYAVKAIKLNVIDFIMKPLDEEELKGALKKAIEKIDIYNNVVNSDRKLLDIVRGETDIEEINHYFKEDNISMMFLDINKRDDLKIQELIEKISNFNIEKAFIIKPHNYRATIIKSGDIKKDIDLKTVLDKDIAVGFTGIFKTKDIVNCYNFGKSLMEEKFYLGYGKVIYKIIDKNKNNEKELLKNIDKFYILLNSSNKSILISNIKEIFIFLKENRISFEICKTITYDILLKIKKKIKSINSKVYVDESIKLNSEYGLTLDILEDTILNELEIYFEVKNEFEWIKEDRSIDRTIELINNNYMRNLKLKDVAKELYINESYLSRRFKDTIGIGFNEYLTKIRMEKAINYLSEGKSIKDISKEVGYSDYRNFSLNFKKHTGVSPSEYKKS